MKILEHIKLAIAIHEKHGNVEVVFGDCNKMFKSDGIEACVIADLSERYLEEVHKDDNHEGLPVNAAVVYG